MNNNKTNNQQNMSWQKAFVLILALALLADAIITFALRRELINNCNNHGNSTASASPLPGDLCSGSEIWQRKGVPALFFYGYGSQFLVGIIFLAALAYNAPRQRVGGGLCAANPLWTCIFHLTTSKMLLLSLATSYLASASFGMDDQKPNRFGNKEFDIFFAGSLFLNLGETVLLVLASFINMLCIHRPSIIIRLAILLTAARYVVTGVNLVDRTYHGLNNIDIDYLSVPFAIEVLYLMVGFYYKLILTQKLTAKAFFPKYNYFAKRMPEIDANGTWLQ